MALFLCQTGRAAVTADVTVGSNLSQAGKGITSPAFSTSAANELLLAYISADSVTTPNTIVQSVSGGGLTWNLVVRTNTQLGTSEIWRAFAPAVLKNVSVSATLSQTVASSITVQSFSGVATSGTNGSGAIGAIASGHAQTGAPVATLVTTQPNSLVVGVGNDYDQAIARTPRAGQALVEQYFSATGDTYWVQRTSSTIATKGTAVTLGDTAPTSDQYNLSICEIVPATQQLNLSANTLAFGSVAEATTKSLNLTLTSAGSSAVTINSIAVTGTGFKFGATALPKTLTPGQTLTIPVSFTPTTAGAVTGKLTINSNATNGATSVINLSGTGVTATRLLTFSASSLAFGSVTDTTTKSLNLTLASSGSSAVTINSAAIAGTGFTLGAVTFPKTLSPGQTLAIPVNFAPTTAGTVAGKLTISSNSTSATTTTIALSGTGVAATRLLTFSATALAFGSVNDTTTKSLNLTLTSSGNTAVTISSAAVTGTGFTLGAVTVPKTLTPGQALVIPVSFAPKTAGAATGSLTISSNATSGASSVIPLTGTGVAGSGQLTLSATSLAFGSVNDSTTKSLSLTLTASGGSVTVNSAAVTGTGFALGAVSLPKAISAGQSLTIPVNFNPTAAGAVTGKLTISSNSTNGATSVVALTGTGVAVSPKLTLSTTTLAFGNVVEAGSGSLTLTLTSSGTAPVTINSVAISNDQFSISTRGSLPLTLSPQQSLTVTVVFEPTAIGTATGTLTLTSNSSSGSSSVVTLTGTGTAAPYTVDLSWDAPVSSADPVAGYHIYRATGSGALALLTSSLITQTSYIDSSVTGGTTYTYEVKSVDASGVESTTSSNSFVVAIP